MKQNYRNWLLAMLCAGVLAAQAPAQPAQPAPPAPPAPPAEPARPAVRVEIGDEMRERAREKAREQAERARGDAQEAIERAREKMLDMRIDIEPLKGLRVDIDPLLIAQKMVTEHGPFDYDGKMFKLDFSRDLYSRGMDALDQRNYERALGSFDEYYKRTNGQKDSRADGALYWKAYTLNKLGRSADATATLAQLEKTYPSSRWLNDAKALQLEVAQGAGKGTSPEAVSEEEMKLLAIGSLANTDPERVVPLLEKLLADPKSTPRLKSRALFVLAQSKNPKAGEILVKYAKGGGNPDVQLKAVEYLGVFNTKQNLQVLADIYGSSSDPAVKRAVLRGYMVGKDKDHLLAAAKSESNVELRQEAIRDLGGLGAQQELAQLYPSESNVEIKRAIIHSMGSRRAQNADVLARLYASESDKKLKTEILRSLRGQNAVKQLIEVARKESDPGLKQEAVRELASMHSKEASDFMMELLSK